MSWGTDALWREDAYNALPERARLRIESEAGPQIFDWTAHTIRSSSRATTGASVKETESCFYVVLGESGWARVAATRSRVGAEPFDHWSGWLTILPTAASGVLSEEYRAPPASLPGPRTDTSARSDSPAPLFDQRFREELGHLPGRTQAFLQQRFTQPQSPPATWDFWRLRGFRYVDLVDERWYWIWNDAIFAFASARRGVRSYSGFAGNWRTAPEQAQLDVTPWHIRSWVASIDSSARIDQRCRIRST